MKRSLSFALLLLAFVSAFAQPKRGFEPNDLYTLKEVADAQIAPDGSRVAFTITEITPDHARTVTHIWLVPTKGGQPVRLTQDEANESAPRWSPDGKHLAFYSDRDRQDGLWVVATGGEPQLAAHVRRTNFFLTHAGESFTWSPDSRRIAFLSDPQSVLKATKVAAAAPSVAGGISDRLFRALTREEIERLPPATRDMILRAQGANAPKPAAQLPSAQLAPPTQTDASNDPRVITRLQYKSRTSFSDNLQSHIFVVDLATHQARQLTDGKYYEHSINWSPKGDEIVFVSNHEPDPDKVNNSDLFLVNATSGAVRQLTQTKGCEYQPVFSPDGSRIAYLATKRPVTTIDSVAEDTHAWVIPMNDGAAKEISRNIDQRVSAVKWWNAQAVIFTVSHSGMSLLYQTNDEGDTLDHFFGRQALITSFSFGQKLYCKAYVQSFFTKPSEVFSEYATGGAFVRIQTVKLSSINEALVNSLRLSEVQDCNFSSDDFKLQGWLVPPINLDEKKKYPVILYIHGGPHGMHGYGFNPTVQALAARGYGVLLINPRGSVGYGQRFADGTLNDWGGGDYRDLMRGVDAALAKFPFLDRNRMGVMGGSYGGYMTNWMVTQTDRFKAAVASASVSNLVSFYSTSLYQDLIHAEFGGYPWDNYDLLWDRSPLKHIKNARTPLMLVHGEADNDVHITQAEEMYTALKMRGVETVLVRYPREGHGVREPQHRVDNLQRVLDWFDAHLK